MHKKILMSILVLIILLANLQCYAVEENNTKYKIIIEDDADLLTSQEESMLYKDMEGLAEYGNIIFKSISTNPYYSTGHYASAYYYEKCKNQSGTVFLIDMYKRNIYIYSDGDNYNVITKAKAEVITDNIYNYATIKEYYKCAKEAYSQIYTLLQGGKIAEPMKYISNALIAVMFALLVNFTIFKTATKNKVASSIEQIKECEYSFEHSKPEVEKTGQHKVYSPISDSSSGGGFSSGGRRR